MDRGSFWERKLQTLAITYIELYRSYYLPEIRVLLSVTLPPDSGICRFRFLSHTTNPVLLTYCNHRQLLITLTLFATLDCHYRNYNFTD